MSHINYETVHIDEVDHHSGLPMTTVSSTLTMVELNGYVKQVDRMNYMSIREVVAPYLERS